MSAPSLFEELRKRKVLQVAAIYGAVAWGVTEVVVTVVEQLFLPQSVSTLAVIGFIVGFPIAMFLSWTFDITPDGIQKTDVTSRRGKASIVLALALLVVGTAGLFLLIKPAMERGDSELAVLPNSLAVLPFENAGRDPDEAYLSEGLSDRLRDQLGRVTELRIAARSSSIAIRKLGGDAVSNAKKLGVAHLVEGSVRRQGNLLSVSVQLIDGANGLATWTDTFERGPGELVNLQQEIMANISRQLLPGSTAALPAPATRSATANEALLLGGYYEGLVRSSEIVDEELLLRAIGHYREAVEADPKSALAQSRLAGALLFLGDLDAAQAAIAQAMLIDPNLSEVQYTLGETYWARGIPAARVAFRRALELNPNNADALAAIAQELVLEGDSRGVEDLFRRALELDRLSLQRYAALGDYLGKSGQVDETLELIQDIGELVDTTSDDEVKPADAYRVISWLFEIIGRIDEAVVWTIRARNLEPDDRDHVEKLAELYAEIGDFRTVQGLVEAPDIGVLFRMRNYDELIPQAQELMIDRPEDMGVRFLLAAAYTARGYPENALWVLSRTGLPESLMTMPRSSIEWESFLVLVNASMASGDVVAARGLAQFYVDDPTHPQNTDWHHNALMACCFSALGRDDEALDLIRNLPESARLPWAPVILDMPCLNRFENEPAYQAMLDHFERRQAEIRKRLPQTLADAGVQL